MAVLHILLGRFFDGETQNASGKPLTILSVQQGIKTSRSLHPLSFKIKQDVKTVLKPELANLISNAVKYTSTHPKREIKVAWKDEGDKGDISMPELKHILLVE